MAMPCSRACEPGAASSDFPRSALPTSICPRPSAISSHGSMDYMAAHGIKRTRPAELVPGTVRVVTARLDYLPQGTAPGWQQIEWRRIEGEPERASISLYARGRDYHKVARG